MKQVVRNWAIHLSLTSIVCQSNASYHVLLQGITTSSNTSCTSTSSSHLFCLFDARGRQSQYLMMLFSTQRHQRIQSVSFWVTRDIPCSVCLYDTNNVYIWNTELQWVYLTGEKKNLFECLSRIPLLIPLRTSLDSKETECRNEMNLLNLLLLLLCLRSPCHGLNLTYS